MKKAKVFLGALVAFALVLSACGELVLEEPTSTPALPTETPAPVSFVVGTGGKGGVFYPYGEGLAKILSTYMPGVTATILETGGSVDNVKYVQSGEAQIGLSTVDSAFDAIQGQGAYVSSGEAPIRALAVLYTSFVHVVAAESSGINSVSDMKGKIISVGDVGSSTEGAADRILEAAGVNAQTEITRQNLGVADSTAALSTGKIDAFFWIGGLPTKAVTDMLASGTKVKFIDASIYAQQMAGSYGPVYRAYTLSKDIYKTEADVHGIGIGNILLVNENMPEEQAYQIVATIFAHLDEVHKVHPEAARLTLQSATTGSSISFHPGAIRFYTEKGVWK